MEIGGEAVRTATHFHPTLKERLVQLPSCFSLFFFFFLRNTMFYSILKHSANTQSLYIHVNSSNDLDGSDAPPPTPTLKLVFPLTLRSKASLFFLMNHLYE